MTLPEILALAVGLAMDAFAVAIGVSVFLQRVSARQAFRLAFHFGLFQALMPILGWLAGTTVEDHIQAWDHWLAFGLLAFVGGKAIWSALRGDDDALTADPTRGWSLVVLSVATSIDAAAVGLSLGVVGVAVWFPALVIGVVTGAITAAGVALGARLGARFGARMAVVGGLVLLGIGFRILVEHLS